MSWDFLNIFKKEDLNKLMFSIMVPGWILFLLGVVPEPINYYILGIAIFASVFCISGVFVYYYKKFESKKQQKRLARNREILDKENDKNRKIEINRMFDGLTEVEKGDLIDIVNNSEPDKYQDNVFHYKKIDFHQVDCCYQMQSITRIFRTDDPRIFSYNAESGQPCIIFSNYSNTITLTIDPYLLDLIKQYKQEKTKSSSRLSTKTYKL